MYSTIPSYSNYLNKNTSPKKKTYPRLLKIQHIPPLLRGAKGLTIPSWTPGALVPHPILWTTHTTPQGTKTQTKVLTELNSTSRAHSPTLMYRISIDPPAVQDFFRPNPISKNHQILQRTPQDQWKHSIKVSEFSDCPISTEIHIFQW